MTWLHNTLSKSHDLITDSRTVYVASYNQIHIIPEKVKIIQNFNCLQYPFCTAAYQSDLVYVVHTDFVLFTLFSDIFVNLAYFNQQNYYEITPKDFKLNWFLWLKDECIKKWRFAALNFSGLMLKVISNHYSKSIRMTFLSSFQKSISSRPEKCEDGFSKWVLHLSVGDIRSIIIMTMEWFEILSQAKNCLYSWNCSLYYFMKYKRNF